MATIVEEMFTESYLEAFYKAHVASRRSSSLDEDIAAIEAEIRKVQQCKSRYKSYCVESNHLNSCGNSECSDDDESQETQDKITPTSVFRVYNSSRPSNLGKYRTPPKGCDVFSWAAHQVVCHDHGYPMLEINGPQSTFLEHDGINLENVHWHQLSASKRSYVLRRLATIIRHRSSPSRNVPASILSYPPSLTLLPRSLAESLRTNKGLIAAPSGSMVPVTATLHANCGTAAIAAATIGSGNLSSSSSKLRTRHIPRVTCEKLDLADIRKRDVKAIVTAAAIKTHVALPAMAAAAAAAASTASNLNKNKRKLRHAPYETRNTSQHMEATKVRNVSTCSEGDDPIEID